jgi:hypothetical protein
MTVMEAGDSVTQATRPDPRVTTKFGDVLRATSIDELRSFSTSCAATCLWSARVRMPSPTTAPYGKLLSDYAFSASPQARNNPLGSNARLLCRNRVGRADKESVGFQPLVHQQLERVAGFRDLGPNVPRSVRHRNAC